MAAAGRSRRRRGPDAVPGTHFNPATQAPQQLMPIDQAPLDLDDVQGNVLIGLQKKAQRLVFFTIKDPQT